MRCSQINRFIYVILMLCFAPSMLYASLPITTDSRIKTFIYNESEVFNVIVHYGYVSNIQFGPKEKILLTYPGNSYAWDIKQRGDNLLFIKALEGAAHTNMTVITNKHTYYFDLSSKDPNDSIDEELVYSVRFFYPDENLDRPRPHVDKHRFEPKITPTNRSQFNFNYTLNGPDAVAPLKVFDDGQSTFFKFRQGNASVPHIYIMDPQGKPLQQSYSRKGDYIVVKAISQHFLLKLGNSEVNIYNEGKAQARRL